MNAQPKQPPPPPPPPNEDTRTGNSSSGIVGPGGDTTGSPLQPARSGEQLFAASIQQSLQQSGELRRLQAAMRAAILQLIRGADSGAAINKVRPAYRTAAIELVHRLIADYLQWSGYAYALEMFATESGTRLADCGLAGVGGGGGGGDATGGARRRMDLARRVAAATEDGGCRLAEGCVDVPVLLAMVVQGMGLEEVAQDGERKC